MLLNIIVIVCFCFLVISLLSKAKYRCLFYDLKRKHDILKREFKESSSSRLDLIEKYRANIGDLADEILNKINEVEKLSKKLSESEERLKRISEIASSATNTPSSYN